MAKRGRPACPFRARARAKGRTFYRNGRPCPKGHEDPLRYVKDHGRCVVCTREKRADWTRSFAECFPGELCRG
jgi:hypothetical protein